MITCSAFRYMEGLVGRKSTYRLPNHKDIFPYEESNYDGALTRVRSDINRVIEIFFKGELSIEEADYISEGTTSECPESRRYEFEILNVETDVLLYGLTYQEGKILNVFGNVPADAIASILRREGAWEGIPELVKDLYRRLRDRIKSENKKIVRWGKERDEIRRTEELTIEQMKKIRELNNRIERSNRIIREDENRMRELEKQYRGIEKIVK